MGCGMCHAIAHGDFSYKDIKNIRKRLPTCARCRRSSESVTVVHGHRSAGGPVLSSEPGLAEDREVEKPCFRIFIFLTCQPKMGIGSRLYASADPSDDARCIWQICPFRSGSPCDLVALREFWKSEKPSVRGTCSNMSMLHDYMVLRSRENAREERRITQYIVYFIDHTNREDTIFAVNTEIQMMYTARWVEKIG